VNSKKHSSEIRGVLGKKPRLLRWLFGFCVWTLLGVSFALGTYLGAIQNGVHIEWKRTILGYLSDFYLWGLLSPLIFRLARRFELRDRFPRNVLLHMASSVVLSFVVLSAAAVIYWYLGSPNLTRSPTLLALWRNNAFSAYYFHQGLTIYWTTLVVAHALHYYRELREEEVRTERLAAQLAQAQLQALKMQIHPHFLFNTLNSISALLHKDLEVADVMIARLGDFLRLTLKRSDAETIEFSQELEFLRCYLDLERTRFEDRLVVEMEIEPQVLNLLVPNLILQPLVENAIRHGVSRQTTAGHLIIRACKNADRFVMQVEDNGPGLETNPNGNGIGLSNTRARLQQFYGGDYAFEIANNRSRGVIVTVDIPALELTKER